MNWLEQFANIRSYFRKTYGQKAGIFELVDISLGDAVLGDDVEIDEGLLLLYLLNACLRFDQCLLLHIVAVFLSTDTKSSPVARSVQRDYPLAS